MRLLPVVNFLWYVVFSTITWVFERVKVVGGAVANAKIIVGDGQPSQMAISLHSPTRASFGT
jgi:hypothetical protein